MDLASRSNLFLRWWRQLATGMNESVTRGGGRDRNFPDEKLAKHGDWSYIHGTQNDMP